MLKTRNIDISTLDRDALLDLKAELWEELMTIKLGLDKAQRKFRREGMLADADWYEQNEERRLLLCIDVSKIDTELRHLKIKEQSESVYKVFYERAAEILPGELFSKIVEQV